MTLRSVAFLSFTLCISAQTPSPKFEVASVRPVDTAKLRTATSLVGIRVTGQQFSVGRVPLRQLIEMAYGIKRDRIEGPGWSATSSAGSFDIEAKMPEGTRPSQVPSMLRGLLEDRFKLAAHMGTKAADFYALVVGKDGTKLTKSEPTADDFSKLGWGQDGPVFQSGSTKTTELPKGLTIVEMSSLADVAALLAPHFGGLPVVDKTGLGGTYEIKLQYTVPDIAAARAEGRLTAEFAADLRDQVRVGAIAGIEKLGLKVEKHRGEIEILIIDHVEKVPTEN